MHSRHSDGTRTTAELVERAADARLCAIALTDHDTVAGVEEITAQARDAGIEVVPALELSTNFRGADFHLLGYFVDPRDPQLLNALRFMKEERLRRAQRIVGRLVELGVEVTMADVERQQTGGTLGRPHVARALAATGAVGSVEEAFQRYLRTGGPAFVEKYRLDTLEGIALLRAARGAAVLAHPGTAERPDLIPRILDAGVVGVEVHHPRNPPEAAERFAAMAAERGLIVTGGSDSHGDRSRPDEAEVGDRWVPYEVVERLRAAAGDR